MNIYRGCMMAFFGLVIGAASILLSLSLGLFGLLLLPALVGFVYLLINTIIVELVWWDRNRHR